MSADVDAPADAEHVEVEVDDTGGYSADISGEVIARLKDKIEDAAQENGRLRELIVRVGAGLGRELSDAMHECTKLATDGFDG